jgi:hypothetical protein
MHTNAQVQAYKRALQIASKYKWTAVLNMMLEDGFNEKMDYESLLELWELSNNAFEPFQQLRDD